MKKRLFTVLLAFSIICSQNTTIQAVQTENATQQDTPVYPNQNRVSQNGIATGKSKETDTPLEYQSESNDDDTIVLHQTAIELEIGEIDTKSIYVEGSHSPEYWNDIAYQSSDESVAIPLGSGSETAFTTIKAVSPGTCDVIAYSISNPQNKATCHVTVYDQMQSVNILQEEFSLSLDETIQLSISVSPATANPEIIWLSSKPAVASVDESGTVTAYADNDSCQIFAYSKSLQKYDVCTISIGDQSIPPATITDGYIVKPTGNNSLTWSIDENGHLEVSGTGNLDENQPLWESYSPYIKTATINASGMTNLDWWFSWCENLTEIDVSNLDTSEVTSMTDMFNGCSSKLDFSNIITDYETITIATFFGLVYDEVGGYYFYRTLSGNINKVILPSKLPDAKYKLLLPSYEKEYYWKNTTTGKVASQYSQGMYYAEEGGVYIKKKGDPVTDTSNGSSASGNQNSSSTNTNGLNYEKIDAKLEANQLSTKSGSIPNGSTFTVTSDYPDNPTVSFDGVNNENADEIVIPESIVYNGITYKVTTVSPKLFTSKRDNASSKVTDNHIDNLTVEYKAPTNKKKANISIPTYTTYKGIKFKVTSVSAKAFKKNKKLIQVKIGNSITSIGDSCFEGCTKLKSVTIGKGLRTIGKNAFKNCKKLSQITIKSTKLNKLDSSCLKGINAKCKISVPKKIYKKYMKLFKGKIDKNVKLVKA